MPDNKNLSLDYSWLHDTVRQRFPSTKAMEDYLPRALTTEQLASLSDDRYLSAMSRRVFQAGMQHSVVNKKWPAFEEVFWGFVPEKMVLLSPEYLERAMGDERIIRHRTKMLAIPRNAQFILDIRAEQGCSFAEFIARWPGSDIIGLWRLLARRGARLGGRSAAAFLRLVGKDSFLLTSDVVARLKAWGVIDAAPGSQRDLQAVQNAFNQLQQDSGRSLCQLSMMLALSINLR